MWKCKNGAVKKHDLMHTNFKYLCEFVKEDSLEETLGIIIYFITKITLFYRPKKHVVMICPFLHYVYKCVFLNIDKDILQTTREQVFFSY